MNTGLRITVFAAALATTFGAAYGVGGAVDAISPEPESGTHGGAEGHAAGQDETKGGGMRPYRREASRSPGTATHST